MRCTNILSLASKPNQTMRTLALNVHFKHPDLGMKQYEILSRATAFLLSVDAPKEGNDRRTDSSSSTSPPLDDDSRYSHLKPSRERREALRHKQDYAYEPAGGKKRDAKDLDWLEFCPGRFRPLVHVVASSHVLSPWLWKNYYPQPWLEKVTQDHVAYSLDVWGYDSNGKAGGEEPLATFALNSHPIHHPGDMDLALAHLKQEESALKTMKGLGVEVLHITDMEKTFQKGDTVYFEGFEIAEEQTDALNATDDAAGSDQGQPNESNEDTRIFQPHITTGNLTFSSQTRFLASTPTPLPEGLCGGPVMDNDGRVCGVVEGIVPIDHPDSQMAGMASFLPYARLKEFVDFAQRGILKNVLPKRLFDKVVDIKNGKALNSGDKPVDLTGLGEEGEKELAGMSKVYEEMVEGMKKAHSPEEVEAILATVEREREEVMDILDREGGDLDEIIEKVRARTRKKQYETIQEIREAEIVSKKEKF